jgi:site-specific recombinase XerC
LAAVAAVLAGIRRERGVRPLRKAQPLDLEPFARLFEPIDIATLAGVRDRAMLLLGFAAALRCYPVDPLLAFGMAPKRGAKNGSLAACGG